MTNRARLGIAVGALAVLAVAFAVISPGESSKKADDPPSAPSAGAGSPTATARDALPPPPEEFTVRAGKVEGGVRDIRVGRGDRVRFAVTSDRVETVHLLGYDIEKRTSPGQPAGFRLNAYRAGTFALERHGSGDEGKVSLIARLVVDR